MANVTSIVDITNLIKMKKLPKFVIHLERLNRDIAKVAFLLEKYEEDRKKARMEIKGNSFPLQTQYLRSFPGELFNEIAKAATSQGTDPFENEFEGIENYDYIEMTVDPSYQIFSVRLLGDISKPLDKQKRYTIFCADNNINPTTINIVSNLRGISDGEAQQVININPDPKSKGAPGLKNVPGRGKLRKLPCGKLVEDAVEARTQQIQERADSLGTDDPTSGQEEEFIGDAPPAPGQEQGPSVEDCFVTNKPREEPLPNPQPVGDTPLAPGEEPVGDTPPAPGEEEGQTEIVWVEKELTEDELTLKKQRIKYNTTAREIVRQNGIEWGLESINKWVLEVGGKKLPRPSKHTVFQPGNKILLPEEQFVIRGNPPAAAPAVPAKPRATWTEFVKMYFFPDALIVPSDKPFSSEDAARVSQKYDAKPEKTKQELNKENKEINSTSFKLEVSAGRQNGFDLTSNGSSIFDNPEKFKSNLEAVAGDPVAVLVECYDEIFNKYDYALLVKKALKCLMPNLTCREILSNLSVSALEDKLDIVFVNQPKIAEVAKSQIAKMKSELPAGAVVTTDMLLAAIQDCIDLEAICNLDFDLRFGENENDNDFKFPPSVSLPQLPITDLYGTIAVEIENAILEALIQSIKSMIMAVLKDLESCSTLDALVAGALQGNLAPEAKGINAAVRAASKNAAKANRIANKLKDLYGTSLDAAQATGEAAQGLSQAAQALGRDWQRFTSETKRILQQGCDAKLAAVQAVIDNIQNVQELVESLGGVAGLANKIASDEISKVDALKTIDAILASQVESEKLLEGLCVSFTEGEECPDNTQELRDALEEVGKYGISPDLESFTLQTIEEGEIKIIAETTSVIACPAKISVGVDAELSDITSENLADVLGNFLDDTISILSPGEFLEALAGLPSNRVVKIIQEIMNTRYPELSCGDPVNMINTFGNLTGLNTLKDQLFLLSQKYNQDPEVPRNFCAEDDVRIELRRALLTPSGLTPEEKDREIERIVNERARRYNDLADLISRGSDITPQAILDNISCGTGVNPNGLRPKVIEDQINASFNMMFDPAKSTFDREIKNLTNAVSLFEQIKESIPRTITPSVEGFEGLAESIFNGFGGGGNQSGPVINPAFQALLNTGFRPADSGTAEDPIGPYTIGGDIESTGVKRNVAGLFKAGMNIPASSIVVDDNNGLSISLKGSLPVQNIANQYLAFEQTAQADPVWNFRYSEKDDVYTLKINSRGSIPSKTRGRIPFFENYKFSRNFEEDLDPQIKEIVENLNQDPTQPPTRKSTFGYLMSEKAKIGIPTVSSGDIPRVRSVYENKLGKFMTSLMAGSMKSFANNRLLKKVPPAEFSLPGADPEEKSTLTSQEELIVLSLINFSPTPTPQQRRCKIEPHLLDLEAIKRLTKEQFENECEDLTEPSDGFTPSRKPINSAGFVGIVLSFIRLYAVEYVFRSIFVLDEYNYSKGIAEDPLMVDYVSSRMKEDLLRLGIWNRFEKELDIAFDKLVEQGSIELPEFSESTSSDDGSNMVSDSQGTEEIVPNTTPSFGTISNGLPKKLKILTKQTMVSVFDKISTLVGKKEQGGSNDSYELSFLKSIPFIDAGYIQREFAGELWRNNSLQTKRSILERFGIVIEKYVRYQKPYDSFATDTQFREVVESIDEWKRWRNDIENDPRHADQGGGEWPNDGEIEQRGGYSFGIRISFLTEDIEQEEGLGGIFKRDFSEQQKAYLQYFGAPPTYTTGPVPVLLPGEDPYTHLPIACEETPFQLTTLTDLSTIEAPTASARTFESGLDALVEQETQKLFEKLAENLDFRVFLNYCLPFSRLRTLMSIYSTYVLNGEEMKFLLEGTKQELVELFSILESVGDYSVRPDLNAAANLAEFQESINNIGNPSGPSGPDALYFASISPILILKGLTELIDPNIFVTSKIVAAAAAGYLTPKLERVSGDIKIGIFNDVDPLNANAFLGYYPDPENSDQPLTISLDGEELADANLHRYDDIGQLVVPDYYVREKQVEGGTVYAIDTQGGVGTINTIEGVVANELPSVPLPLVKHTPVYQIDWEASFAKAIENGTATVSDIPEDLLNRLNNPQEFLSAVDELFTIGVNTSDLELKRVPPEYEEDAGDLAGQPRSDAGSLVIKRGIGFVGIPVPGGETNSIVGDISSAFQGGADLLNQPGQILQEGAASLGGQLGVGDAAGQIADALITDFDINIDLVPSAPVYPGEPVNLPYGLISLLLRPANVFFPYAPYVGPPYGPLGPTFLEFEPAIYELPYFQTSFSRSGTSRIIKDQTGVDLAGGDNFVCPDVEDN